MKSNTLIAGAIALAAMAGLVGYEIGRRGSSPNAPFALAGSEERTPADRRGARAANQRVAETTTAASPKRSDPATPDPIVALTTVQRLRLLADLQKQKLIGVGVNVVARDGKVGDSFARLLDLSEGERATLQQTIDEARERLNQLLAKNAAVRREDDTLILSIAPFEQGAEVYDSLMDGLQRVLGADRFAAYMSLTGGTGALDAVFDNFGTEERTITFWRVMNDTEQPTVFMRDARKTSNSSGGTSGPRDFNNLPFSYRWMKSLEGQVLQLPAKPKGMSGP